MISLEYWFMFPVSIAVATVAMATGIGGAVFFSPIFLLGLQLEPSVAIGTALITEFFGFSSGVLAYLRQRLIDFGLAFQVLMFAVPAAVLGSVIADYFPAEILRAIFAVGIVFIGSQIFTAWWGERETTLEERAEAVTAGSDLSRFPQRSLTDRDGTTYNYRVLNKPVAGIYASIGGLFVGMISVGLAELMEFQLVGKCKVPARVAVATSIFMVLVTVFAASIGHIAGFVSAGSEVLASVLSICVFTAPGVLIGGQIGPLLQKAVPAETMKVAISVVFVAVGLFMLASLLQF